MNSITINATRKNLSQALVAATKAEFLAIVQAQAETTKRGVKEVLKDFLSLRAAHELGGSEDQVKGAIARLGKRSTQTIYGQDLPEMYQAVQAGVAGLDATTREAALAEGVIGLKEAPVVVPTTVMVKRVHGRILPNA